MLTTIWKMLISYFLIIHWSSVLFLDFVTIIDWRRSFTYQWKFLPHVEGRFRTAVRKGPSTWDKKITTIIYSHKNFHNSADRSHKVLKFENMILGLVLLTTSFSHIRWIRNCLTETIGESRIILIFSWLKADDVGSWKCDSRWD